MWGKIPRFLPWVKPKKGDGLPGLIRFLRQLTGIYLVNSRCAYFQDDGSAVAQLADIYDRLEADLDRVREYLEAEQMAFSKARVLAAVWFARTFLGRPIQGELLRAA